MSIRREIVVSTVGGVIGGLVTAAAIGAFGLFSSKQIASGSEYLNPTCEKPRGLKPVDREQITVSALSISNRDMGVTAARKADKPHSSYVADKVIDGFAGSIWIPPVAVDRKEEEPRQLPKFSREPSQSTLDIVINQSDARHDIRLVCVNNALGGGDFQYANWGKTKTIKIWTGDDTASARTAVFQALPADESGRLQQAGENYGTVEQLHIQLLDAYAGGQTTSRFGYHCVPVLNEKERDRLDDETDGAVYRAMPEGCVVNPTSRAGLSELVLYEVDDKDPNPLPFI